MLLISIFEINPKENSAYLPIFAAINEGLFRLYSSNGRAKKTIEDKQYE
jgi:hypothetical protein